MSDPFLAQSTLTWYFSVDSTADISADTVSFSLDKTTWATGTFQASPPDWVTGQKPAAPTGLTRYWWSIVLGPDETLAPEVGTSTVYGRVVDNPDEPILAWQITVEI